MQRSHPDNQFRLLQQLPVGRPQAVVVGGEAVRQQLYGPLNAGGDFGGNQGQGLDGGDDVGVGERRERGQQQSGPDFHHAGADNRVLESDVILLHLIPG